MTWSYKDYVSPEDPEADELEAKGRGKASADGTFVRNLKIGDVVGLWARSRFPGWENRVLSAEIRVFWAV